MIAGLLLRQQLEQLAADHPLRNMAGCIHRGQVKNPCNACRDICPAGVYSGKLSRDADFSACINCGLCVSACPARCIAPSAQNAAAYLRVLELDEDQLILSERDTGPAAHLQVPALAGLPWEYLALLGMEHRVVLLEKTSTPADQKALWEKTLVRLVLFFGTEGYQSRFTRCTGQDTGPAATMDRRQLFTRTRQRLQSSVMPKISADGLVFRALLDEKMRRHPGRYGFPLPMPGAGCTGCGVCALLCPQKALTVTKNQQGFAVTVQPLLCNGCGLCQKACIERAIPSMGVARLTGMGPVCIFRGQAETKEG